MRKLLALLLTCALCFEFSCYTYSLNLEETNAILDEMVEGMGIHTEVKIIPCDYAECVNQGKNPLLTYGWVYINADYQNIYINDWYLSSTNCDYVWTVAHELTHIKQIEDGTIDRNGYAYYQSQGYNGYDDMPNEKEAEAYGYYYFVKYNRKTH